MTNSKECSVCKELFMKEYIVITYDNKLMCVHCIADYSKFLQEQQEKNMLKYMGEQKEEKDCSKL